MESLSLPQSASGGGVLSDNSRHAPGKIAVGQARVSEQNIRSGVHGREARLHSLCVLDDALLRGSNYGGRLGYVYRANKLSGQEVLHSHLLITICEIMLRWKIPGFGETDEERKG